MRLIDADELVSEFACRLDDSVESIPTNNIIGFIESAPDVDAEPVVRCKDCEYWSTLDDDKAYSDKYNQKFCVLLNVSTHAGFYCALAERKTDGTDDD